MDPSPNTAPPAPTADRHWRQQIVSTLSLLLLAVISCGAGLWWMQGGSKESLEGFGASVKQFVQTYSNPANLLMWMGGSKETMESLRHKNAKKNERMMYDINQQLKRQQRDINLRLQDTSRQLRSFNRQHSMPRRRR